MGAVYGTADELQDMIDWDFSKRELRMAEKALMHASVLARHYGRDWPEDSVPEFVQTLVYRAAKRYMDNPSGNTDSRAGDETLGWTDAGGEYMGTVYFTAEEQRQLAEIAGKGAGLVTVNTNAWGEPDRRVDRAVRVPVDYGGKRFPYYSGDDPW